MKTRSKALLLTLCAVLLVAASVLGTMAYLTSTDTVTNTFTVGNVSIKLDEALVDDDGKAVTGEGAKRVDQNSYKLLPGHVYDKDPTITVDSKSEDCWLVATVTINNLTDLKAIYANDTTGVKQTWGLSLAGNGKMVSGGVAGYDAEGASDNGKSGTMLSKDNKDVAFVTYEEKDDTIIYTYWFKEAHKANATEVLFEKLNVPGTLDNDQLAKLSDLTITVKAYAIQKDGFNSVYDAWNAAFPTN